MRKPFLIPIVLAAALAATAPAPGEPPPDEEKPERELYVPFEDLSVLLRGETRRVLLTRKQFEELLEKARTETERRPPREALLAEADYHVRVREERAEITGTLTAAVLEKGLHTLGLDASGVGIRRASLDGRGAPLGLADDGRLVLFVEGVGRHALEMEMVTPLQTTAARQLLTFQVPVPTATRLRLTVPGDVEVVSGAPVVSRVFDEEAEETRFVLLPRRGTISLVMTLNSRLKRRERVVVARSVLVDEVTHAYERLHATVSLDILHRAVEAFRFEVPEGFEITDVHSPRLARWAMAPDAEDGKRVLEVRLREETTETVVLNLSAVRTEPDLENWRLPQLRPLETVGHMAVVGLLLEDRLQVGHIATEGLIPIDNSALVQAIPPTVLQAEPGAPTVRPVVAYYAPQSRPASGFELSARFEKPPARLLVTTNILLVLTESGLEIRGGFAILPQEEKVFALDFTAPADWDVAEVTGEGGKALPFERYRLNDGAWRIHVRLPQGVSPGSESRVFFRAEHVPADWFGQWEAQTVALPTFAVLGATRDVGAVAVDARDDMQVRPETLEGLVPLDENEKARFGLGGVQASVAYRYESQPYNARLTVERIAPRLTAETYSFLRIGRDALFAHYELVYEVREARSRRLAFILPEDTPTALSITGLEGTGIKEYRSEEVEGGRRWVVSLAKAAAGTLKLAVDFQKRLGGEEHEQLALPIVEADGVEYQSGFVAVEGSAELVCEVTERPREVDVGELVDAAYQPGKRLLGAYVFVGEPEPVRVRIERPQQYFLPPAIVERAELATLLSTTGLSQNAVRLRLRTKASFVQIQLPEGSALWSVTLDSKSVKPQREGDSILVSMPAHADAARDLTVTYETPVRDLGFWEGVTLPAPRLLLHASRASGPDGDVPSDDGYEVPVANLVWHLYPPADHRVVSTEGNVVAEGVEPITLAATRVAETLYWLGGGIDPDNGLIGLFTAAAGTMAQESRMAISKKEGVDYEIAAGEESGRREPGSGVFLEMPEAARAPDETERVPDTSEPEPAEPTARPAPEPEPPPPADKPKPEPPGRKRAPVWALAGARSLKIDLTPTGRAVTFRSLGAEPRLGFSVAHRRRLEAFSLALALAVLVAGLAMTKRPAGHKIGFVAAVLLAATLLPAIPSLLGLALLLNGAFYVACLLIPYYLLAALVRWVWAKAAGMFRGGRTGAAAATTAVLLAVLFVPAGLEASSTSRGDGRPYVIQVVPPPDPVEVPADAVVLPYDPDSKEGVRGADRLLVPYERFVELWHQAYPDERRTAEPPPAPYALAGASFTARLQGTEYLLVEGRIDLDVYAEEYVEVPLPLEGGVLARADLDGEPARLSVATLDPKEAARRSKQQRDGRPRSFAVLYARGKGRHRLDVAVRMKLERQGGWRVAHGRLPAAPATDLELHVPEARTEIRLGAVPDRRTYETSDPGEVIRTALDAAGELSLRWRPKVSEGQIDRTLTAHSDARFDIQEDQVRLTWRLSLSFRRGEREFFSVELPPGYLVEKVAGTNVRGWEVRNSDPGASGQELEVGLLKPARESETFTVHLWRAGPVPADEVERIAVPVVNVAGAIRHTGRLVVWRSPLLDLRTLETEGARRTDLPRAAPNAPPSSVETVADESPLGIRPYQAYEFVGVPFTVRLGVRRVDPKVTAEVQTILRIAEREHRLESRVLLSVENRPAYRARVLLPADLEIDKVSAPGVFEYGVTRRNGEQLLTVYFTAGLRGRVPVLIRGHIDAPDQGAGTTVPRLEVLGVERQRGDIVIQADPAYDVRVRDLVNLERAFLKEVRGWLVGGQRRLARLALRYKDPDYAGRLALVRRTPKVSGYTLTNVRVTDRAIEETVLLVLQIREAGIREVKFLLPAHMAEAEVRVPLLRHKTVDPIPESDQVRFTLELQDEVTGELRIVVENDRLLTGEKQSAPIPVLETGTTERRYVALESSGRDEVNVVTQTGLETLGRRQREWKMVAPLLRGGATDAFIVMPGAEGPALVFKTVRRETVDRVGARIGLGRTVLLFDSTGAYQGVQTYRVSNSTEQFLSVEMPPGATLWTAWVAGRPVKPAFPDPSTPRRVDVPLVKTARGELDYAVVLKYGGRSGDLRSLSTLEFPLIRTTNIAVERNGAEVYVPRTHTWFWFGGHLIPETRAGDLQALAVSYYADQIRRQEQALQTSNEFAQVRAAANLKALKRNVDQFKRQAEDLAENPSFAANLEEAQKNLRDIDKTAAAADVAAGTTLRFSDNRGRLNEFVTEQDVNVTSNAALDVGGNWDAGAITAGTVVDGQQEGTAGGAVQTYTFNDTWLARNKLQTRLEDEDERRTGDREPSSVTGVEGRGQISKDRLRQFAGYQRQAEQQRMPQQDAQGTQSGLGPRQQATQIHRGDDRAQPLAPQLQMKDLPGKELGDADRKAALRRGRRGQRELVERYQKKLERRAGRERRKEEAAVVYGEAVPRRGEAVKMRVEGITVIEGEAGGYAYGSVSGVGGGGAAVPAATGLTSIDVDLLAPADASRFRRFTFTGPRGDATVTAWAASERLVAGLKRLLVVVVALAAVVGLRRLLVGRKLSERGRRFLTTVLILVGLGSVFTGFLPVAGWLALLVGIAWKIVQIVLRRRREVSGATA